MSESTAGELREPAQASPAPARAGQTEPEAEAGPVPLPPWRPSFWERVRETWHSRHLLPPFFARTFGMVSGGWVGRLAFVLLMLLRLGGPAILVGGVFGTRAPNGVPYLLFLMLSMQGWVVFQRAVIMEIKSSRLYRRHTKQFKFPLLLIPIAGLGGGLLMLMMAWFFIVVLLFYYGVSHGQLYLQAPPRLFVGIGGVALCFGYALALGLFLSVVYPLYPYLRLFVRQFLRMWVFITPVYYPLTLLHSPWNTIAELNPLTSALGMIQYGFLDAGYLTTFGVLWTLGFLVVLLFVGVWFYNRFATQWIGLEKLRPGVEDEEDDEGI